MTMTGARQIMTANCPCVGEHDSVLDTTRRLAIEHRRLVGIISQGDIARQTEAAETGGLVESISSAPPNNRGASGG